MICDKEHYINSVNLNANTDFPYLILNVINDKAYPRNLGFQVMHWHEDLQFIYVFDGIIEVKTLEKSTYVKKSEGIFINKNVVHDVHKKENCHYNSFIFPADFLGFYTGSPAKTMVDSIVENEQLTIYHFTSKIQWCNEILTILKKLSELDKNKTNVYAYEVLVLLCSLWLIMQRNIILPDIKPRSIINIRMRTILRYIEEHFSEDVTLADLANSANISKSECARCFKISLNTTPYKYLTEFRLLKATQLLKKSDEAIGNISTSVGFHQISHFGKCFKEKTGYSPSQYRKIHNVK
ncbi:AraC family transcriptional regulator [Clostridioides difficile]|nr:AraC family transcriptional regulator [Clostridioides difficile]